MTQPRTSVPVTIEIPAPAPWISANTRYPHWAVKARLVREWRKAGHLWGLHAKAPTYPGPVHITATIHRNHNRGRIDPLNYADTAKACVDGLVDAGVLSDDSSRQVIGPDMRLGDPRERAFLVLTITPTKETR